MKKIAVSPLYACECDWRVIITFKQCYANVWGSRSVKQQVNLGFGHPEGWFSSWGSCRTLRKSIRPCFVDSISLRLSRRLIHVIIAIPLMFTLESEWKWVDMGGGITEWYQSFRFQTLGPYVLDACFYACVVMVKVVVCTICHYDVVGMLWGWNFC